VNNVHVRGHEQVESRFRAADSDDARAARIVIALVALPLLWLFTPSDGGDPSFPRLIVSIQIALFLLAINLISFLGVGPMLTDAQARRRDRHDQFVVALDLVLTIGVVAVLSRDAGPAGMLLLGLPVAHAAARFGRTAFLTCLGTGALASWLVVSLFGGPDALSYDNVDVALMGIVGAGLGGFVITMLIRLSLRQIESFGVSRSVSERKAELLQIVTASSRRMATLDSDHIVDVVVRGAAEIGFAGVALLTPRPSGRGWAVARAEGLPEDFTSVAGQQYREILRRVMTGADTVIFDPGEVEGFDHFSSWSAERRRGFDVQTGQTGRVSPTMAPPGPIGTIVATPVKSGGGVMGVLVAAATESAEVRQHAVEGLELLALQAGAAMESAGRFLEKQTLERQLAYDAFYDGLTGLANRSRFVDRLSERLRQSRQDGSIIAVLFLDLDRFKLVNDTLGHDAGDALLMGVAKRIEQCVRGSDLVARFGGDEFTILVDRVVGDGTADVAQIAQRIMAQFAHPFNVVGRDVYSATSIGVAFSDGSHSSEDLVRRADMAMYRAKKSGPGKVVVFDEGMTHSLVQRLELETDLRQAVARGQLSLVYQPIVSPFTNRITAAEALLRWNHPTYGMISPADFLPMAEETGLIVDLGLWVLDSACAHARRWVHSGLAGSDVRLQVNLSAVQLAAPDLVEKVAAVLEAHSLEPYRLVLEVAETTVISDQELAVGTLERLRDLGVAVSIDDFGQGHSSLGRLKGLPVDQLKIDKSFIDGVAESIDDRAIVRSITVLAHDLDLEIVAEGVEAEVQRQALLELGCDGLQGFYLYRPMPIGELLSTFAGNSGWHSASHNVA
jgi:diguanylate cyclase (GGDEF)-like protein